MGKYTQYIENYIIQESKVLAALDVVAIDEALQLLEETMNNEVSVKADYYRNTNREYSVHCQVMEKKLPLIDLTVTVPSEEEAKTISNNWHKKNQEIYAQIMAELL